MKKTNTYSYKYKREKNNFMWTNDIFKIEYTDPSIETHSEVLNIKRESQIMYFYYTFNIYKKAKNGKWAKIESQNAYDFPGIFSLRDVLDYMINQLDIIKDGQKTKLSDGSINYAYKLDTKGFISEDYYEVTKEFNSSVKHNYYNLFFGCSICKYQGDVNFTGLRLANIEESEIKELMDCINAFISFAMDEYNKQQQDYVKLENSCRKEIDGKIYEYQIDYESPSEGKLKDSYENIYCVGDEVEIDFVAVVDKEFERQEQEGIISNINKNTVELELMTKPIKTKKIDIDSILYISVNIKNEKLSFGKKEIIEDFKKIMTKTDEDFFKNNNEKDIYEKYGEAIADRTWMYRKEHPYIKDDKDNREQTQKVLKDVIKTIKKSLT